MPVNAMAAGADMASVSMHKSGGSLTQSSLLLTGPNVNWEYVSQIINLTQTTSASYLLLSSLDISRRNLYMRGEASFGKVQDMAEYAREEINSIGGFYAYGRELKNGSSIYDFDVTKLSVYTRDIGLAGIEVYHPSAANNNLPFLEHLAEREGILTTGGSDFHGPQVRQSRIGEGLERWTTMEADMRRLMNRIDL